MTDTCGCCAGIEEVTPTPIANRPGLSALAYRTGIHPTFLETMLADLSKLGISRGELDTLLYDPAQKKELLYPLKGLTARTTDDPAIALLDAWAIVADILTFYQECIANEGYLRTATERRSILELARLVGYTLRPGVAASVFLSYTLEAGQITTIPKGTRAQSLPGPGQFPQSFETSADLEARADWNAIKPRMSVPQYIIQARIDTLNFIDTSTADGSLYLDGVATQLQQNDPLLFVFDDTEANVQNRQHFYGGQVFTHARKIDPHPAEKYTRVELPLEVTPLTFLRSLLQTVDYYLDLNSFDVSPTSPGVANVLSFLQPGEKLLVLLEQYLELEALHLDSKRTLEEIIKAVEAFQAHFKNTDNVDELFKLLKKQLFPDPTTGTGSTPTPDATGATGTTSTPTSILLRLSQLTRSNLAEERLAEERLSITITNIAVELLNVLGLYVLIHLALWCPSYSAAAEQGDTKVAPWLGGLIADLKGLVSTIPLSLTGSRIEITGLPSLSAAALVPYVCTPVVTTSIASLVKPLSKPASLQPANSLRLQRNIGNTFARKGDIAPQLISKLNLNVDDSVYQAYANANVTVASPLKKVYALRVKASLFGSSATQQAQSFDESKKIYNYGEWTAVSPDTDTRSLYLDARYDQIVPNSWIVLEEGGIYLVRKVIDVQFIARADYGISAKVTHLTLDQPWDVSISFDTLQKITVYAQSEELPRAEEPLTDDIKGDQIELDDLYDGLQSGRWAVVSGERTDIHNTSGLRTGELVMLASVTQNTRDAHAIPDDAKPKEDAKAQTFAAGPAAGTPAGEGTPPNIPEGGGAVAEAVIEGPPPLPVPQNPPPLSLPGDTIHTVLKFATPLAYTYKRDTVAVNANVVKATHGETRNEVLGSGDGSQSMQQFTLRQFPLTYTSAPTISGVESTLAVYVNDVRWHETDNLDAAGQKDRVYVTQTSDDDKTTVIFGNGTHGTRPPTGAENIIAIYRNGIGTPGNVAAGQISLLTTRPFGVRSVVNPLPATGGADKESRDQARRNAPLAVMSLDRLVSVQDYADFARTYAGIGKASATQLSDGRNQLVYLTIAGIDNIPIATTSDLYQNLFRSLRQYGNPSVPLLIALCEVKLLVISAKVRVLDDFLWEAVAQNIRTALLAAFSFEQRDLGQPVYQSEVLSVIQGIAGVSYVELAILDAVDQDKLITALTEIHQQELQAQAQFGTRPDLSQDLTDLLKLGLYQVVPVAQAQRDLKVPTLIHPAQLAFLSPAVSDTLILTELNNDSKR